MTPGAMEIPSMAHLTALFLHRCPPDPAMRVHPEVAMRGWLQVHRFGVTEIAAIAGIGLNVARHALRHRRKIRLAGHFRFVDPVVTRQTRNRCDVPV